MSIQDVLRGEVMTEPVTDTLPPEEAEAVLLLSKVKKNEESIKGAISRVTELERQHREANTILKQNEQIRAENVLNDTDKPTIELKNSPKELSILITGVKGKLEDLRAEQVRLNGNYRAKFYDIGRVRADLLKTEFKELADKLIKAHTQLCAWDDLLGSETIVDNSFRNGLHITGEHSDKSPLFVPKELHSNYKPMLINSGFQRAPVYANKAQEIKKELLEKVGHWGLDKRIIP